jgi:hypothetical protein
LLKADSAVVSIEQVCVWRETSRWMDHARAILVGFSAVTIEEVLSKHTAGNIHLEGQIDGAPSEPLPALVSRSYGFELIWQQLASSYLAGSRGTCSLRLFSYARFRGDALDNLDRPANGGTPSPDGTIVSGYHRLITDICLRRQEALGAWDEATTSGVAVEHSIAKLHMQVIDELLCLHLGGPIKKTLDEYIDLVGRTDDDLTEKIVESALRKESPRLHEELLTGRPQSWSFGRASYIQKIGKKHTVHWSPLVESLLLRMRHDSPHFGSWAALYRGIREVVGGGRNPTDKAIKIHFKNNYPNFFSKIKLPSRIS